MVNNSININKTNCHLSSQPMELNKKTTTYKDGNPGPGLGQAHNCGGVKPVNGSIFIQVNLKENHYIVQ